MCYLDVSPGRADAENKKQKEDLGEVEGTVEDISDEAHDEEGLEPHEDNQPGQQQHPLALRHSNTRQTEIDQVNQIAMIIEMQMLNCDWPVHRNAEL